MKANKMSDVAVQLDQDVAIKAGLQGIEGEVTGIHVKMDTVGFVRFCRENDLAHIHCWKGSEGRFYLGSTTDSDPCIFARTDVK